MTGFEPATFCLQVRRSEPTELHPLFFHRIRTNRCSILRLDTLALVLRTCIHQDTISLPLPQTNPLVLDGGSLVLFYALTYSLSMCCGGGGSRILRILRAGQAHFHQCFTPISYPTSASLGSWRIIITCELTGIVLLTRSPTTFSFVL